MREDAIAGCLLGTAVGDALGVPMESMSARRGLRLYPAIDRYQFLFRRGMFSDDTEHACMTAQALLVSGGDPRRFLSSLGWRLRGWLLGLPIGTGRATLKACVKLWLGWPPRSSGVWSAGNGPCMRAPIIGVCCGTDAARMRELVLAATRITHTDPKAFAGAMAIAVAAAHAAERVGSPIEPGRCLSELAGHLEKTDSDLIERIAAAFGSAAAGQTTPEFAHSLGQGRDVTGYVYNTVPVVLHAWAKHPDDYRAAVQSVIRCGGDTDTLAAIVGGLVGARVGRAGIPSEWLNGMCEWPRNLRWMERLAARLVEADGKPACWVPLSVPGLLARNLLFDFVVMVHVFRRLLPPY